MAYRNRSIPDSDHGVRRFCYNFSRRVAEDPGAYGLTSEDAGLLVAEADRFIAASMIAVRPSTRTRPAVRAKDDARAAALVVFRRYAGIVKANPTVSQAQLVTLGLVPGGTRRASPTPPPTDAPVLRVRARGSSHELVYADRCSLTRRGKPVGVSHVVILRHVGPGPISDVRETRFLGAFTRWPIIVRGRSEDAGQTATYFAAWLTASGGQSPWSAPVSMTVVGARTAAPIAASPALLSAEPKPSLRRAVAAA